MRTAMRAAMRTATGCVMAVAIAIAAATVVAAPGQTPAAAPTAESIAAGKRAFIDVAKVLQSPRCRNCHPAGDRPLQGDAGQLHRMNISRHSAAAGLPCTACHQSRNADALGLVAGPPGAPHWGLPPAATPMVFEGLSARALCAQLVDPEKTNGRDLPALLSHMIEDSLVLWAWNPGGGRTVPPMTHAAFVAAFRTWVASGGACP
jgi:hypothetical protein